MGPWVGSLDVWFACPRFGALPWEILLPTWRMIVYEVFLVYAVTFVGGVLISFVVHEMDWRERLLYGVVNALIFGTILLLTVAVLTAVGAR